MNSRPRINHESKQRFRRIVGSMMKMKRIAIVLCCILTVAVPLAWLNRAPSRAKVMGRYIGRLNGAVEIITLHTDGTFSQELRLPSAPEMQNKGSWSLSYKAVDLDGYILFYDGEKKDSLVQPEKTVSMRYVWGANMLIRDWGSGYYTLKHQ